MLRPLPPLQPGYREQGVTVVGTESGAQRDEFLEHFGDGTPTVTSAGRVGRDPEIFILFIGTATPVGYGMDDCGWFG